MFVTSEQEPPSLFLKRSPEHPWRTVLRMTAEQRAAQVEVKLDLRELEVAGLRDIYEDR